MKTIDVEGLPAPIVKALETIVQTLRGELHDGKKERPRVELPTSPGGVLTDLSRAEIYDDVLDRRVGR